MLVGNPILNSPFDEPTRYWAYEEGQPVLRKPCCLVGYDKGPHLEFGPRFKVWRESYEKRRINDEQT